MNCRHNNCGHHTLRLRRKDNRMGVKLSGRKSGRREAETRADMLIIVRRWSLSPENGVLLGVNYCTETVFGQTRYASFLSCVWNRINTLRKVAAHCVLTWQNCQIHLFTIQKILHSEDLKIFYYYHLKQIPSIGSNAYFTFAILVCVQAR